MTHIDSLLQEIAILPASNDIWVFWFYQKLPLQPTGKDIQRWRSLVHYHPCSLISNEFWYRLEQDSFQILACLKAEWPPWLSSHEWWIWLCSEIQCHSKTWVPPTNGGTYAGNSNVPVEWLQATHRPMWLHWLFQHSSRLTCFASVFAPVLPNSAVLRIRLLYHSICRWKRQESPEELQEFETWRRVRHFQRLIHISPQRRSCCLFCRLFHVLVNSANACHTPCSESLEFHASCLPLQRPARKILSHEDWLHCSTRKSIFLIRRRRNHSELVWTRLFHLRDEVGALLVCCLNPTWWKSHLL